MHINSAISQNWLQSVAKSGQSGSAKSTAGQTSATSSLFSGQTSTQAPSLASLSSPSQLFSSDSLSALISAQTTPGGAAGVTSWRSADQPRHGIPALHTMGTSAATDASIPTAASTGASASAAAQAESSQALNEMAGMLDTL